MCEICCRYIRSCQLSRRVAVTDVRLPPSPSPTATQFHEGDDVEVNIYPAPDSIGDGVLLFFDSLFFLSARLQENGWTDLHEIFRVGVEWPWDDLIEFWVSSEKPHDAAMLISLSAFVKIISNCLFWQSCAAI